MEEEEKKVHEEKTPEPEVKKEGKVEKKENDSNQSNITEKMRENPWMVSTLVLGILCLILLTGAFSGGATGNVVSEGEAGKAIMEFVQSQTDGEGELVKVNSFDDNLYEIVILYQGNEVPLYITKDGKNLVQGVMPLVEVEQKTSQSQESADVPKSDKPVVELFIMSMCPFGTQAVKGIIPVLELLGDKIDFNLRFVSYAMHGKEEIDENTVQYCVQKEQPEKLLPYLRCFLEETGADKWAACQSKVGINKAKLNSCIQATDTKFKITELFNDKSSWSGGRYPQYNVDAQLNIEKDVKGSPSLAINGVMANSGRSPAAYLETICSAFNQSPGECLEELSNKTPSPGFGGGEGSATNEQC